MKMSESTSVNDHVREMIELFDKLTNVGDPLKEKDRVMILMASLPAKYDILITSLQTLKERPSWEMLVEKLNGEESRQSERQTTDTAFYTSHRGAQRPLQGTTGNQSPSVSRAHLGKRSKKDMTCHYCKRTCLLYTSPSPRDKRQSRMPSSA